MDSVPLPTDVTEKSREPIEFYHKLANVTEGDEHPFKAVATLALQILALAVTQTWTLNGYFRNYTE